MRFVSGALLAALAAAMPSIGTAQAAQYNTINAVEIERLLGGSEQENSVATFYIGGVLDTLSLSNTMLAEQGTPLYCPGAEDDLRPSVVTPKLLEHIAGLRRKPRAAQALEQLTTGTVLLVMLTTEYPCAIDGEGQLLP